MDFEEVTVLERNLEVCLTDQQAGVSVENACTIKGGFNSCPAGATLRYQGLQQSIDAYIQCPLDSVQQSDWLEAAQDGLCGCDAMLYDKECGLVEEEMDCECFACPFGMKLGFAYTCTTEIVGPCKSFDCFGKCNMKYDPGNLVGDKETYPPTADVDTDSGAIRNDVLNNHVMGTAVIVLALFRMIF